MPWSGTFVGTGDSWTLEHGGAWKLHSLPIREFKGAGLEVAAEGGGVGEVLGAERAAVLDAEVGGEVAVEAGAEAEGGRAELAAVGLLARVEAHVADEVGAAAQLLPADAAEPGLAPPCAQAEADLAQPRAHEPVPRRPRLPSQIQPKAHKSAKMEGAGGYRRSSWVARLRSFLLMSARWRGRPRWSPPRVSRTKSSSLPPSPT